MLPVNEQIAEVIQNSTTKQNKPKGSLKLLGNMLELVGILEGLGGEGTPPPSSPLRRKKWVVTHRPALPPPDVRWDCLNGQLPHHELPSGTHPAQAQVWNDEGT